MANNVKGNGVDTQNERETATLGEEDVNELRMETEERDYYNAKAEDFLTLHDSIQSSNQLLDSLTSFLSNFQTDLSSVSGHLKELQGKSHEIDALLDGRKTTARSLDAVVADIILPPDLIILIRDTAPGDGWLPAIVVLEEKIEAVKAWSNVKAAAEVGMVVEGLKAKAITSLRSFLLNMIKPIRATVSTNIQMIQSSILLKYLPFFSFLRRQAPKIAAEVQRVYVNSARTYYETSFRRYTRALGHVKARTIDRLEYIGGSSTAETVQAALINATSISGSSARKTDVAGAQEFKANLAYSRMYDGESGTGTGDGAGMERKPEPVITLPQAEDKDFIAPPEAVFRSLMLVLLDNGSSEFTFLVRFFAPTRPLKTSVQNANTNSNTSLRSEVDLALSPTGSARRLSRKDSNMSSISSMLARDEVGLRPVDSMSQVEEEGEDDEPSTTSRVRSQMLQNDSLVSSAGPSVLTTEALKDLEVVWKQVMETSLEYCQTLLETILEPLAPPTTLSLMSIIRLNDIVTTEIQHRGTLPLESFCFSIKLRTWPILTKQMDLHVESLKKLADSASSGSTSGGGGGALGAMAMLSLGLTQRGPTDQIVRQVCERYSTFVVDLIALNTNEMEMTIHSSMVRLRTELERLIKAQAAKYKPAGHARSTKTATAAMLETERRSFLSSLYEDVIRGLQTRAREDGIDDHQPRFKEEIEFFKQKEADAMAKIGSSGGAGTTTGG